MKFVSGKVLKEFSVKGRKIKFRFLKKNESAKEMMEYINKVVTEENNWLAMVDTTTLEGEKKWLKGKIEEQGGRNKYIVVDVGDKVMGTADIRFDVQGNAHTVSFGISLDDEIRGMGIGTKLLKLAMKIAKDIGAEIFYISTYKGNERALHVYKDKLGFKECGVKPMLRKRKVKGKNVYDDGILLWRKA